MRYAFSLFTAVVFNLFLFRRPLKLKKIFRAGGVLFVIFYEEYSFHNCKVADIHNKFFFEIVRTNFKKLVQKKWLLIPPNADVKNKYKFVDLTFAAISFYPFFALFCSLSLSLVVGPSKQSIRKVHNRPDWERLQNFFLCKTKIFFRFLLLSLDISKYKLYFLMLQTLKLNNKNLKNEEIKVW